VTTTAIHLKVRSLMAEDLRVRGPRPAVSLTWAAAAVMIAGVTVIAQAGDARPGGVRVAAADPAAPTATPRATSSTDPDLTAAVKTRMDHATASSYGVVIDVDGLGRVVALNGGRSLLPASTEKLFTALPLLLDHATDRLATVIGATAAAQAGVVHGDLIVRTSGDPTLMAGGLVNLARQVHAAGVRRVTGRLVLATGNLPWTRARDGWKSSYVPWDVGPLSPFPVHYDVWKTSNWYVGHPTAGNLALLRGKLAKAGVHIVGGNSAARNPSIAVVLAQYSSASMADIVRHTLRQSDNFAAEQMLSMQGWTPINDVVSAAHSGGTATDGSGLSLRDRRTAAGEVALLEYAHSSAAAALLVRALPVACQSGTLKDEFCNTVAAGAVFAKTGTINHVKALAGYTTDANGRWVTFAFITNGDTSTSRAMTAIVRSVLLLRHYAK
jgi:D-alanyl-D-alanine carboxypeptidase/D-alanyl-D-alanine-endopeptidase (penicillin-binding protein 4)